MAYNNALLKTGVIKIAKTYRSLEVICPVVVESLKVVGQILFFDLSQQFSFSPLECAYIQI